MDWNDNTSDAKGDKDVDQEEHTQPNEVAQEEDVREVAQEEDMCEQRLPRRQQTQPHWMQDYFTGEGLSDDDLEAHLTLGNNNNPVHYKEAAKNPIWRKAM